MNKEDTMNFENDQVENANIEASEEIDIKQIIPNKRDDHQPIKVFEKLKIFFLIYWRGIMCLITPLIMLFILLPLPPKKYQICGYTLIVMAIYWVTECIPLPVTSFLPVVIFPLTGVMSTRDTCKCYMNDTIMMFLGSMILAYSVEQSGLHHRLALCAIRAIGYSHYRLLFALCFVTMFISMWITNTAAVTMMVPIIFALLKVFEDQGQIKVFERTRDGETIASDLTVCYFCAATCSATIGGIGTLVGTVTNLVFKGLFSSPLNKAGVECVSWNLSSFFRSLFRMPRRRYSEAPDYLSFPMFSAFAVPYMIAMEVFLYFSMCVVYLGLLRPKSVAAERAKMTPAALNAVKSKVDEDWKKLGKITFWEIMVITLFTTAMCMFFGRSPQVFVGWGDRICDSFGLEDYTFILDSATAMLIATSMFLLPSNLKFLKNFTANRYEELPNTMISSVLDWTNLNSSMPYSFMFLLGGGFALSEAAKPQYSDLNGEIGKALTGLKELPNELILLILIAFAIFVTNFASNVAVCNVITPIGMQLAQEIGQNPLWYCIATGFSASYCFCLPVGTPGNLIAQGAANIPTPKMIIAGLCPTIFCLIITWIAFNFYAPIIWPDLRVGVPKWI